MATTRRIQRVIDGLKPLSDVDLRVLSLCQRSTENRPSGDHLGTPYTTAYTYESDKLPITALPAIWKRACRCLKESYRQGAGNILYKYAEPTIFDLFPTRYARRLGYRVIYDIIEDPDVAATISRSLRHQIKTAISRAFLKRIATLADGVIVISNMLLKKLSAATPKNMPIHMHRISVDTALFPDEPYTLHGSPTIFYAGSFGVKDGVETLIDAFERAATEHPDIRLILAGKGAPPRIAAMQERVDRSPCKDRIEYRGYLLDDDYYELLGSVDIPCVIREDTAFAQAGFPFKLGEFLAAGKPVIVSRVSDVEELLSDRVNALLVRPGSSEDIAEAICEVLQAPERTRSIADRGRAVAAEHFDHLAQGHSLRAFLRKIAV